VVFDIQRRIPLLVVNAPNRVWHAQNAVAFKRFLFV
jgi:hypothetical protein